MSGKLLLFLGLACVLPASAVPETVPPPSEADQAKAKAHEQEQSREQARRMDPAIGNALTAAVKAGDAKALKALLDPADRSMSAGFCTTEDVKRGGWQPFSNLFSSTPDGKITPCDEVLIEYGVGISARDFNRPSNVAVFKAHYPDFTTTLGRRALDYSAETGNNEMIRALLAAGVKPEPADLEAAVDHDHPGAVKLLVAAGLPADAKGRGENASLTLAQIARRNMAFAVLDALGAAKRYEAELKPFREGRPGEGAVRYSGKWEFKMQSGSFALMLEPDGTGFAGDPFALVAPILWKSIQVNAQKGLEIMPVPGTDHGITPFQCPVSGDDVYLSLRAGGNLKGVRREVDSDQREAIQALAKAKPYTGPSGEWHINLAGALDDVPADQRAQAAEQFKTMKLTIARDGSASLVLGPTAIPLTVEATERPDELRLTSERMPPTTAKGSNNWKEISIAPPGETHALHFERVEK